MKLVDILARQLKVWPEGVRTICQGPQGWLRDEANYPLEKQLELSSDWQTAKVTHADWQAAVEALKAEQAAELKWPDGAEFMGTTTEGSPKVFYRNVDGDYEYRYEHEVYWSKSKGTPVHTPLIPRPTERAVEWDGVGSPPVGTVVHTDHKRKEMTVKILAYGDHHKDKCVLVADMSHGREGKMFGWIVTQCVFRPIRTQEQIAAEEREKAIQEICTTLGWRNIRSDGSAQEAAALYDAGYRKQVAK